MNLEDWPNCPVEGCPNKICLALNSEFCFPHTPGNKHVKGMKIDARNCNTDLVTSDPAPNASLPTVPFGTVRSFTIRR